MKVSRIDITGFKSFPQRTMIKFSDGVTGVVGPNGCGKSNIVDAIFWVMGDQSAKHLRGRSMEDVVFNGTDRQSPNSMAEVSIVLSNDGGPMPPELSKFEEVRVTRRLFRSGESEYLINMVPCRLKDITELFLGTGIGANAYSIIEQGKVSQIVEAKPAHLRTLIEEVAGVTRYRLRKKVAERRIEEAQNNLNRLNDIIAELDRTLASLKRQAKKAERFRRMRDELREIELRLTASEYIRLRETLAAGRAAIENLRQEEAALIAREAVIDEQTERTRVTQEDLRERINSEQEHLKQRELKLKEIENDINSFRHQLTDGRERRSEKETALAELDKEYGRLATLISEKEAVAASLMEKENAGKQRCAVLREALSQVDVEIEAAAGKTEELRGGMIEDIGRLANERSNLATLGSRREDLRQRLSREECELAEHEDRLKAKENEVKEAASEITKKGQLQLHLTSRLSSLREAHQKILSEYNRNDATIRTLQDELANCRSRHESLCEIQRNYEGCGQGVRSIMKDKDTARKGDGIFGLVSDIIEAPEKYEAAVEAVLGEKLQYVVVESQQVGIQTVDYLKAQASGRASLIPIKLKEHAEEKKGRESKPDGEGVIGPMLDFVKYPEQYGAIAKYLLDDVVIIDKLDNAVDLFRSNGHTKTLVTIDGDVMDPAGIISGGAGESAGMGLLARKREIGELAKTIKDIEAKLRLADALKSKLYKTLSSAEQTLNQSQRDADEGKLDMAAREKDIERLQDDLRLLAERREVFLFNIEQTERQLASLKAEEERTAAGIATIGEEKTAREAELASVQENLDNLKAKSENLDVEAAEADKTLAVLEKEREKEEERLREIETRWSETGEKMAAIASQLSDSSKRADDAERLLGEAETAAGGLAREIEALRSEIPPLVREFEELKDRIAAMEAEQKQTRTGLEQKRNLIYERQMALQKDDAELGFASRAMLEKLDLDLAEFTAGLGPEAALPEAEAGCLSQRAEELRKITGTMEDVNLLAISEFEKKSAEYRIYAAQRDDLAGAIEGLRKAITRINRTCRKRFKDTFEAVNAQFSALFPKLFNGGRGWIELQNEEDLLEAGVQIIAQPPGKKLQSIELMSGGEKALTALCLIFSIFLLKPSPFCVMDEVDAPLDDSNIGRFCALLREFSRSSQFILITHNKVTMETADVLYGMTMEEPGVTKVLSMKFGKQDAATA